MKWKEQKPETKNEIRHSFDIVIPHEVFFHPNLTNTEKMLFGLLLSLARGKDGCYNTNSYLGDLLGVSKDVISRGISNLQKNKFIKTFSKVHLDESKEFKTNRKIVINPELCITKNESENIVSESDNVNNQNQKSIMGIGKNADTPSAEMPILQSAEMPSSSSAKMQQAVCKNAAGDRQKCLSTSAEMPIYIGRNADTPSANSHSKYNNYKNNKNKKEYIHHSNKKNKSTWSQLCKKYGRPQVRFVKHFLEKQKENFPKFIKENITPSSSRMLSSLDCLDKLQRIDGFDFETEIKPTLEAALQDEFWARNILSLGSLRKKGKNGEKKFVNIMVTLSNRTKTSPVQLTKSSITPEDIIAEQGWDDFRVKLLRKNVFDPVFSKLDNASSKTEVTRSICKLIKEIEKRQKRPQPPENEKEYQMRKFVFDKWELIPKANRIVKEFVEWLDNQDWIGELKPGHFDIDGRTFAMFRNYYQDSIGGFDIFEGRMLG